MNKGKAKFCLQKLLGHWMDDFNYLPKMSKTMQEAIEYACDSIDALPDGLTVRINTHGNSLPVQHGEWIDLMTAEDVKLQSGEYKLISLGVSMELPRGYYAKVAPRSSTCMKWGIIMANSVGIIENSYCGDNDIWGFPAYAIRDTEIFKGTRIAQFCICKQEEPVIFEPVESLGNEDRGGWGSTGI